jgi:hypothetical protein
MAKRSSPRAKKTGAAKASRVKDLVVKKKVSGGLTGLRKRLE